MFCHPISLEPRTTPGTKQLINHDYDYWLAHFTIPLIFLLEIPIFAHLIFLRNREVMRAKTFLSPIKD